MLVHHHKQASTHKGSLEAMTPIGCMALSEAGRALSISKHEDGASLENDDVKDRKKI